MRPGPSFALPLALVWLGACATETTPLPPLKPPLEYLGEWGTRGDGPGQLSEPAGIAVDFAGNVYVADAGNGYIHKFDPLGKPLLSFNDPLLKSPRGIAVDDGGGIYVADSGGNQLLIFKPDGDRFLRVRRSSYGPLRQPFGVAVTPSGTFYVTDGAGATRYNARGRPLNSWGILGDSPLPKEAASAVAAGPDGNVYVSDRRGAIVQRFGPEGLGLNHTVFSAETVEGSEQRQKSGATGVAASDRFVFLVDEPSARLFVWSLDETLRLNRPFADLGAGKAVPVIVDVAWSPKGELLLLDQANARVLRFRVNL